MDRLTKLASKLYPRWWRERYGEEFAALLEDARPGIGGTLDVLKGALTMQLGTTSAVKTLLLCAIAGVAVGLGVTFLLTPQYSSNAVVSVRPSEGSKLTDITDVINQYSQNVLTRPKLSNLIRTLDLYKGERNRMPTEDVLELMKQNIRISAAPAIVKGRSVPAFELSFHYPDNMAAQSVVTALVSGFIDENMQGRAPGGVSPTMEVLDPASLPTNPIFPIRKVFAMSGLGAGLALGGIAALVLHFRRKRQLT
jgi:hypothetical protein